MFEKGADHEEFFNATFCPLLNKADDMMRMYAVMLREKEGQIVQLKRLAGEMRVNSDKFYGSPYDELRFGYQCRLDVCMLHNMGNGYIEDEIEYIASMHARKFKAGLVDEIKRQLKLKGYTHG